MNFSNKNKKRGVNMSDSFNERITQLDSRVCVLEKEQEMVNSQLQKIFNDISSTKDLVQEVQKLCIKLEITNHNQNELIQKLDEKFELDKSNRYDTTKWFLRTIGAIIIGAIMTLILI